MAYVPSGAFAMRVPTSERKRARLQPPVSGSVNENSSTRRAARSFTRLM